MKYSNVYKNKAERCEMMECIKNCFVHECITFNHFYWGCGNMKDEQKKAQTNKTDSKEEQIKKSFAKTLDMYPIKNLEDLYDKEGYRDGEFEKGDKGMWVLYSSIVSEFKGERLKSRGMVLKLDRNKRTAKGSYIIRELKEDKIMMFKNEKVSS